MCEQKRPIHVGYLIESLNSGGAERQLVELVTNLDRQRFLPRVLVWTPPSFFQAHLIAAGIPVHRLIRKSRLDFSPIWLAAKWLRSGDVDVLHGYLDTGNLYAVLATKLARQGKAIVSERNMQRKLIRGARLHKSWAHRAADLTIANSEAGRQYIRNLAGIEDRRILMIPNGINTERFASVTAERRITLRHELGWPLEKLILLSVGRIDHPQKGLLGLVDELAHGHNYQGVHISWIGTHEGAHFQQVKSRLEESSLASIVDIRAPMNHIEQAYQACDILILNSSYEGTPNVVLEAMACECPVLSTAVGDTGKYVIEGSTGWLIPPHNPDALNRALHMVLASTPEERKFLGRNARRRVLELGMDVKTMVRRHEQVYMQLAKGRP